MSRKLPFIKKGHTGSLSFTRGSGSNSNLPFLGYFIGVAIFFLVIFLRLFQLSIVKGDYYAGLADDNRTKEILIEAPRGKILDRKKIVLAENVQNIDGLEELARVDSKRVYKKGGELSHLIGYRQIADENDIKNDRCVNKLDLGDKTGKKGVEKLFECELRGKSGKKLVEVDALGKVIKTLSILDPVAGQDIQLAVDSKLQEKANSLMIDKKGSIVVLNPKTGEVLVLESSPGFNPQVFEDGSVREMASLIKDTDKPLFNRSLEGNYPPGSTFKMFVATAGLEEGVIEPEDEIEDNGFIQAGPLRFHNWYYLDYGGTDGKVNLVKSLQRSNDIYYYLLGEKLGPDKIKKWAEIFGFQNKTGIGLNEITGIVPSPFWKEQVLGERWFLGDTYNLSIGQGYVTATPLQIARATAVFANDGYLCTPKLLKSQSSSDIDCQKVPIGKEAYRVIREGMHAACQPGGTAYPFFDFKVRTGAEATSSAKISSHEASLSQEKQVEVGCKTGTAESHAPSGKPNAWFTIFAPFENPEIVVTVLVEEGGQGSDVAAPIAKEIVKEYLETFE